MNDNDRSQWIDNDEGLYDWWRSSRLSKAAFIKANRAEIDAAITPVLDGDQPASYLKYGDPDWRAKESAGTLFGRMDIR